MKLKIKTLLPIILLGLTPITHGNTPLAHLNSPKIKLEANILKLADGKFINADTVELIRKFQRKLVCLLFGETDTLGRRIGHYRWQGSACSIHDLCRHEHAMNKTQLSTPGHTSEEQAGFTTLLQTAKGDFMKLSSEFRVAARGSKPLMSQLVKESCQKRDRENSLLTTWAKTKEEEEDTLFAKHVTSFALYEQFVVDLLNFQNDLINSCPKALAQFQERVNKWTKIKEVVKTTITPDMHIPEDRFCAYVKMNYLDKLKLVDITPTKIKALAVEFKKQ